MPLIEIKKDYFSYRHWSCFFFGSPTRKKLSGNFFSLSLLQAANYILPLLALPYLVRILGPANFGIVAFAQSFINYFNIFTDYGFNLSATRNIALNRNDKKKTSDILSSVLSIKLVIGAISLAILLILLEFVPKFSQNSIIYLYAFGIVLGNIFFPIWFFQGMEKMKFITILNITAKLIFTVLVFVVIRGSEDYIYVPLLNSLGYIVAGIVSLIVIVRKFNVRFVVPSLITLKDQLVGGWHIFISSLAVSVYTSSNSFVLGFFADNTTVGYYSAAEKLIGAATSLLSPISQTVYPHLSVLAAESKNKALAFIKKLIGIAGLATFTLSMFIFTFAPIIIKIVLGVQYEQSVAVLKILAFLPFIIELSNIFTIQGLYVFGLQRVVARFVIPLAAIHLVLLVILVNYYSLIGAATAIVITESMITVFSAKYFIQFANKR